MLGLRERASANGNELLLLPGCRVDIELPLERQFNILYQLANSPRLDAFISITSLVTAELEKPQKIEFVHQYLRVPVASVFCDIPGAYTVLADNHLGMRELMQHLLQDHGYKRFAFMKGPDGNTNAESRFEAFCDSLREAGLVLDPRLVVQGNFTTTEGCAAMADLLDRQVPFDAVVVANDGMAYGALSVALERGWRVPQDFAVTGFDDSQSFGCTHEAPNLTTVSMPLSESTACAVDLLNAHFQGEQVPHLTLMPTRLVRRISCGCGHELHVANAGTPHAVVNKEDEIFAVLNLPPALQTLYRGFYAQLEQSLAEGARAVEECVSSLALELLRTTGDVSRLQTLVLSMYRYQQAAALACGEVLNPAAEFLLNAQLTLINARNTFNAGNSVHQIGSTYEDLSFRELNFLKRQLIGSGREEILSLVESAMHEFEIPSAYIVLYQRSVKFQSCSQSAQIPRRSEVVFAMTDYVRHRDGVDAPFPTEQLLPDPWASASKYRACAVLPIFQHIEHHGYMVLDLTQMPQVRLETLRDEISSTLIHSILVGELERSRDLLKVDLTAATHHNAQLFDELVALNRRLQSVLDAAQEVSIIATDPQGAIQMFNRGAERMLGYSAEEILGKSPVLLHLAEEIDQRAAQLSAQLQHPVAGFETFVAMVLTGNSETRQWTYVRKDGHRVKVSLVVSAVRGAEGDIDGFLGIAIDITEQLAAQSKLVELNTQLDQRVHARTEELKASNVELGQALERLQQTKKHLVESEKLASLGSIVAAVAHELNTPIGNCLMMATTLQDRTDALVATVAAGGLSRKQFDGYLATARDCTALMLSGLERAVKLVNNFKQVSVNQSSERRCRFDLRDTLDAVVALITLNLHKTPYRVELDVPKGIEMDGYPGSLERVVTNLMNNSLIHGFEGRAHGVMHIWARCEGGHVRLLYSDDGVGMSATVVGRVFDPFFTTKLGKGGSGLGMNICYNLVVGPLGGSIEVTSELEQGCTFTLRLPSVAPTPIAPQAQ